MSRRMRMHDDSSQMSNILAPEVKQPPIRDFHKENLNLMKQKEVELQQKYTQLSQQPAAPEEWKMKKFQGIESKVSNMISGKDQPKNNYQPLANLNIEPRASDLPPKPMNKAQLIRLRVQQEQQLRHAVDAAPIV